jgi:hypothetical protein
VWLGWCAVGGGAVMASQYYDVGPVLVSVHGGQRVGLVAAAETQQCPLSSYYFAHEWFHVEVHRVAGERVAVFRRCVGLTIGAC